jgi:hypothetical protein
MPIPMRPKVRLTLLFYRSWAFASNLATALCVWLLLATGVVLLPVYIAFRLVVAALIWYVMREYGARRIYYFTNLGMTPRALWGWSMALDMVIFVAFMAAAVIWRLP